MMDLDRLNAASDLRRIAGWVARGQKEKLPLIKRLWGNFRNNSEVYGVLKHFRSDTDPEALFKSDKRIFNAEQLLISSLRLQNS